MCSPPSTTRWDRTSSDRRTAEISVTTWEDRQTAFVKRLGPRGVAHLETGTVVVLNSLSFSRSELEKITGVLHYEERLLFMLLYLSAPDLRIVYPTSLPIDPAIVDYYLRFVPEGVRASARERLALLTVDDPSVRPLSDKLLERPEALSTLRALAGDPDDAYLLPFTVTASERALSEALGLPLYGSPPHLVWYGSKTGSRRTAREAGVRVLEGHEELWSFSEIEASIEKIRQRSPHADGVVIKLNNGFSGQGNVIVELRGPTSPLASSETIFCAPGETWPSYEQKVLAEGAIVEELVREKEPMVSPSVQIRIAPGGSCEVISTHDQVLGGPEGHVYMGCRFPADEDYRLVIQDNAAKVAKVLADEGVMGSFGIDFLVAHGHGGNAVYLSEINLRMGGTTHPYWMARLATGGEYDTTTGELVVDDGSPRRYVASDNVKDPALVGRKPAEIIDLVDGSGLAFDPVTKAGVCLHLLGALEGYGKMGATCIAPTLDESQAMYDELVALLSTPLP